jgi:hypothetical protein
MALSGAERSRAFRARRGAATGRIGRPAVMPCGTNAAYARHLAHKETPCAACKAARAAYVAEGYRRRALAANPAPPA